MPILYNYHVRQGLDRLYKAVSENKETTLDLSPTDKYIIFSDHHKGTRDGADDFRQCEYTYLKALEYYLRLGHTLIILGDAEELHENVHISSVLKSYDVVLQKEADFHREKRYIRIFGNHDDTWGRERYVRKYLHPIFPGLKVHEGFMLQYKSPEGAVTGRFFLAHGHQGTLESDRLKFFARLLLPFYKLYQIITGDGRTSPSGNPVLRAQHDTAMYLWAAWQKNLVLIAGHTHRPVWCSMTHVEKIALGLRTESRKVRDLIQQRDRTQPAPGAQNRTMEEIKKGIDKIRRLKEELAQKTEKYYHEEDTIKTLPVYFNTGCCRFEDGDITGIEIEQDQIRLIKWGRFNDTVSRSTLESDYFSNFFNDLDFNNLLRESDGISEQTVLTHS